MLNWKAHLTVILTFGLIAALMVALAVHQENRMAGIKAASKAIGHMDDRYRGTLKGVRPGGRAGGKRK